MKRKNVTDEDLTIKSICRAVNLTTVPFYEDEEDPNTFYWSMMDLALRYGKGLTDYKSFYQGVCYWGFDVLYE